MPHRATAARRELLLMVFAPDHLPPVPGVALQVYARAESPDYDPDELAALLATDPALCAGVLRTANSCVYALSRPVCSPARAVQVLGRRTVRALALALSAPGPKSGEPAAREYWLGALGGAVIARELAARSGRPDPDEDMAAALLRDVGCEVLRRAFPSRWNEHQDRMGTRAMSEVCRLEVSAFGVDHADVGAELLSRWGLPNEMSEPVRYHHYPKRLPAGAYRSRGKLLWIADRLIHLEALADHPDLLEPVLETAKRLYGLDVPGLVRFLTAVAPKVDAFANALNVNAGQCPNLGAVIK